MRSSLRERRCETPYLLSGRQVLCSVANKLFVRVKEGIPELMREETPQLSSAASARVAPPPRSSEPFGVQPDTLGFATRLAVQRLKQEGIEPGRLVKRAGLSMARVEQPDARLSVRGQIAFLDLAAKELNEPFLGHKLAGISKFASSGSSTTRWRPPRRFVRRLRKVSATPRW